MKTEYKRDLQNNYLILEAPDVNEEGNYGLRMAEQNQVRGLLPVHGSRKDGKLYLHYEITSKRTLESVYEKKVMGYQDILSILTGLRDTLENMRKYLLSPQQLLFAPEMIYLLPERKELLLCYYVRENECPIRMLAEFILKRLDHRDRQAVALGYGFFERASGENFSLAETLREVLMTFNADDTADPEEKHRCVKPDERAANSAGSSLANSSEWYEPPEEELRGSTLAEPVGQDAYEEPYVIHRERSGKDRREKKTENSTSGRNGRKADGLTDRLFAKVHPAVLLSFLALTVVLEILIMSAVLSLTESGGCFFLMLSLEILLNRRLLRKKETMPEDWDEEDDEEYQKILQEIYQDGTSRDGKAAAAPEPIEETRCLIPKEDETAFYLVCCADGEDEKYPEIRPGSEPVYIGKIKGDVDVLLNASTVSRMHARIQMRQGQCFIRDMNSKNGTLVNGRRLEPQEECELREGDIVAFAQIQYQVVKRGGIY